MKTNGGNKRTASSRWVFVIVALIALSAGILFSFLILSTRNSQDIEADGRNTLQSSTLDSADEDLETDAAEDQSEESAGSGSTDIRISAVGDIMLHETQLISAYDAETDTYNFNPVFEDVKPIISNADLAIANLETTLSGLGTYSGYPLFNAPDTIVDALKGAGFDTLITANNHSLDTLADGLRRTVKVVRGKELDAVGSYERDSDSRLLIKDVKGIRIAILAYTEMLNSLDASYSKEELNAMVNVINKEQMSADLSDAKEMNPDLIITYMHWGEEYAAMTSELQNSYAEMLAEEGVDIVLGSHPHVIQPTEQIDSEGHQTFVAYSLGNFVSNQRSETLGEGFAPTEDGVILNIDIQKNHDTGQTIIYRVESVPTWVYRYETNIEGKFGYRILPIESALKEQGFPENVKERMERSLNETRSRLNLD